MARELPRAIWALGFVSMFMDISSEMIHGLLPLYLTGTLAASVLTVGLIEGSCEAAALLFKVISGPISDGLQKRKGLTLLGYSMGTLSKPVFALAPSVGLIFAARFFDRVGKGIRGAPRDALIADLTPASMHGSAYGLRQSLDTIGACLGPLIATVLMAVTGDRFRVVFLLATLPGLAAVGLLAFGVREPEKTDHKNPKHLTPKFSAVPAPQTVGWKTRMRLPRAFWFVAITGGFFQLARLSEAFLILNAARCGLELTYAPVVLICMNTVYALVSYPAGKLSDRSARRGGRSRILLSGLAALALAHAVLAFWANPAGLFAGVSLWGLHMGLTQGILAALVADTAGSEQRGTAFGVYNLISACGMLLAGLVAGYTWQTYGAKVTFLTGTVITVICTVLFWSAHRRVDDLARHNTSPTDLPS